MKHGTVSVSTLMVDGFLELPCSLLSTNFLLKTLACSNLMRVQFFKGDFLLLFHMPFGFVSVSVRVRVFSILGRS
jgi:hypothetical protein